MLTLNDGRKELYQWDSGRTATVDIECNIVHFANLKYGESLAVEVKNGEVAIPDKLLTSGEPIYCWAFVADENGNYTKQEQTLNVNKRAKPSDYVYTETETLTWKSLDERITELEKGGTGGPSVSIDDTLTISGAAADAKATGDQIRALSDEIANIGNLGTLTSPDGTKWTISVSNDGIITATKKTSGDEPETLETYTIFVPENVSDEWNTGGTGSTTQAKTLNISTSEFIELFYDGFVSTMPSGVTVTKTSIGKDQSGLYDMWEYDFCPDNYSRTILLSSGMHTYELSASFGLANFISHLYTDTGNEAFDYILKNVRVKVIPIVNPWGFNQSPKKYGNMNGVNPNRNFDFDGAWTAFPVYTPSQNEWNVKGDAPFSEAEVRNLAEWALANTDAEFWIDCHTGLGYSDYDNWIYYSSDDKLVGAIQSALAKLETWFKETYGSTSRTHTNVDHSGSIRLRWAENCAGIPGLTVEQAPGNTIFGTANNNDNGDISNYSTCISTYVQELLLEKYRSYEKIAVTGVSVNDVSMQTTELSKTVTATLIPSNTTQTRFVWTSDNENVCKVYGGCDKAIVVKNGAGTATITVTSAENPSVSTSFTVTVAEIEPTEGVTFSINGINLDTGEAVDNSARLLSNKIAVNNTPCIITVTSNDGYLVKVFGYDANGAFLGKDGIAGDISTTTATSEMLTNCSAIRILLKKSSGLDFTEEEATSASVTLDIVSATNLEIELGTLNTSTGLNQDSTTRCRSVDYIPIDASENIQVSPLLGDFYFVFRAFGENYAHIGAIHPVNTTHAPSNPNAEYIGDNESQDLGWCQGDGYIDVSRNGLREAKYLRLIMRRKDDGEITLPVTGFIEIGGILYSLS